MADIDIGSTAIDRASYHTNNYTWITDDNPANDDGTITSIEVWMYLAATAFEVATFIDEGSNVFSTRDSESIGSVTAGSKQTFSGLAMDVQTGDYIGWYDPVGKMEATSGGANVWAKYGDNIPCSSETFGPSSSKTQSLYGEGEAGVTEKTSSDTGSGVDACVSLETPEAKTSSDAGSGAESTPMPAATLAGSESGSGIEALIARLLASVESGTAAEAAEVVDEGLLKDLFASELGQGADCLIAKIEIPTKGGGMKLWT
jgi:hypothetical protein